MKMLHRLTAEVFLSPSTVPTSTSLGPFLRADELSDFVEHGIRLALVGTRDASIELTAFLNGEIELDSVAHDSRSSFLARFRIGVESAEEVDVERDLDGLDRHVEIVQQET
ncbi:MAG TPA: hypothetical protein VFV10_05390 [Gammaproteobacteria bacterium]|nr:hypothetical protein [Gammaproteobacteria bacterium]